MGLADNLFFKKKKVSFDNILPVVKKMITFLDQSHVEYQLFLFGSFLYDQADQRSDLDLALVAKSKKDLKHLQGCVIKLKKEILFESDFIFFTQESFLAADSMIAQEIKVNGKLIHQVGEFNG